MKPFDTFNTNYLMDIRFLLYNGKPFCYDEEKNNFKKYV